MPDMVIKVPYTGTEKDVLRASLDRHREAVLWKLRGLDGEQVRRRLVPSGTSLLGLVKHLSWVEYGWFGETFGRESKAPAFDPDDPEADLRIEPDESTSDVVAFYREACVAANAVIDELDPDHLGRSWHGDEVSMRWVLVHMIEETARHAGHMDILRELIDGATGDHDWDDA